MTDDTWPVMLGGKWWTHTGDCSEVQSGPHIHYGQNVIVGVDPKLVPEDVLDGYYELFRAPEQELP